MNEICPKKFLLRQCCFARHDADCGSGQGSRRCRVLASRLCSSRANGGSPDIVRTLCGGKTIRCSQTLCRREACPDARDRMGSRDRLGSRAGDGKSSSRDSFLARGASPLRRASGACSCSTRGRVPKSLSAGTPGPKLL